MTSAPPPIDPAALLAQLAALAGNPPMGGGLMSNPSPTSTFGQPSAFNNVEALLRQFLAGQAQPQGVANQPAAPSSSTVQPKMDSPNMDSSFHRGNVDMDKLAPWQRDEILRKQKQLADNQEALKRQIEEKNRLKEVELQKEKDRERKEQERLDREQRELEERYKRENDAPIPTLAGKKDGGDNPFKSAPAASKDNAAAAKMQSQDGLTAEQRYLQAQAEAEALRKNKFKHKRANGGASNAEDLALPSTSTTLPSTSDFQAPRAASPPIPTLRANKSATPQQQESLVGRNSPRLTPTVAQSSMNQAVNLSHDEMPVGRRKSPVQRSRMADIDSTSDHRMASPSQPKQRKNSPKARNSYELNDDDPMREIMEQLSDIKHHLARQQDNIQEARNHRTARQPFEMWSSPSTSSAAPRGRQMVDMPAIRTAQEPAVQSSDNFSGDMLLARIIAKAHASENEDVSRGRKIEKADAMYVSLACMLHIIFVSSLARQQEQLDKRRHEMSRSRPPV
jgi:hypothetical protein